MLAVVLSKIPALPAVYSPLAYVLCLKSHPHTHTSGSGSSGYSIIPEGSSSTTNTLLHIVSNSTSGSVDGRMSTIDMSVMAMEGGKSVRFNTTSNNTTTNNNGIALSIVSTTSITAGSNTNNTTGMNASELLLVPAVVSTAVVEDSDNEEADDEDNENTYTSAVDTKTSGRSFIARNQVTGPSSAAIPNEYITEISTVIVVCCAMLAAILLRNNFAAICSIIGAVTTTTNSLILPLAFYSRIVKKKLSFPRKVLHIFILILAVSTAFVGAGGNICVILGVNKTAGICRYIAPH